MSNSRFRRLLVFTSTLVFLTACEPPSEPAKRTYFDEPLGWLFPVPEGWDEGSEAEQMAVREKGLKSMERSLGVELDNTSRPLLYLKYDKGNRFTSNVSSYDALSDGPYEDVQQIRFQAIRETFAQSMGERGLVTKHEESDLQIDGVPFAMLMVKVMTPGEKTIVVTSVTIDGLIRDSSLLMSYACQSEPRCEEIHSAILESTFNTR